MPNSTTAVKERLESYLDGFRGHKVALAFSAGTDSSLLLNLLVERLSASAVVAFTVTTVMHPVAEISEARAMCEQLGVEHHELHLDELSIISDNPVDRCYRCKSALMGLLKEKAQSLGCDTLIDGTNADDLKQYRPGLKAIKELGIVSPLANCGITKQQVRAMLANMGLKVATKPSAPCLATRFPYNTHLDSDMLQAIGKAEDELHAMGFYNVRVRAHPTEGARMLRLEIDVQEFPQVLQERERILELLHAIPGYDYVSLDLDGFSSGSMDKRIVAK